MVFPRNNFACRQGNGGAWEGRQKLQKKVRVDDLAAWRDACDFRPRPQWNLRRRRPGPDDLAELVRPWLWN